MDHPKLQDCDMSPIYNADIDTITIEVKKSEFEGFHTEFTISSGKENLTQIFNKQHLFDMLIRDLKIG